MRKIVLYVVLLSGVAFLSSCKDDTDGGGDGNTSTGSLSDSDKSNLYDKVWYSTNPAGGIDHEFLTDGTLRLSQSLDGRWTWLNNGDTMNCVNNDGARFSYVFQSITSSSMSFKASTDNFGSVFGFRDTE